MGSWSSHYNSWKNYKSKETLLVKYEDMVNEPNSTFLKVLNYLKKITKVEINHNKLSHAIYET